MRTLKFSRITNFTGRNGFMKCAGVEALATDYKDPKDNLVILSAMTSRWTVGRCDIFIPKEDVVAVCELLLKEAGIKPIRIPSIPVGAIPADIDTRTDMQKMAAAKCAEWGYDMAPGWSSFGEVSPPDQLSLFTCTVMGRLPGDAPETEISFQGHTPQEALADLERKLQMLGE